MDHAPEVDADHPLPVLERDLPGRAAGVHTGVVAEHVDGPEVLDGTRGERVDRGGGSDVGGNADDLGGGRRSDLRNRQVQPARVQIGHHDAHALGGKALAEGAADAAGGAGHDRNLALEVLHSAD